MPVPTHSGYRTGAGAGASQDIGGGLATYSNWTLVPTAVADDSVIALEVSPDNSVWTRVGQTVGRKPVVVLGFHIAARYARVNVVTLGTGTPTPGIGGCITAN